jgi:transglutaminase-like putative cysteine protease
VDEYADIYGNPVKRFIMTPGPLVLRYDAVCAIPDEPDPDGSGAEQLSVERLPGQLLHFTLPSRYCLSDELMSMAWELFGQTPPGGARVQAICDWVHSHVKFKYGTSNPLTTAVDVYRDRIGVCRDFAHLVIALNRTFNLPARYVTGHLPDIGFPDPDNHMDFHAYAEVYIGGTWFTTDARFHVPRIGRIKVSCGQDAVDGAFSTIYGGAALTYFEVWAYQVARGSVGVGDPIDLARRLDNQWTVVTDG